MKIEVDGIAMELEPGKHYLIVYDRSALPEAAMQVLPQILHKKWGIDVVILKCHGNPKDALRIVKVEEPEHGQ